MTEFKVGDRVVHKALPGAVGTVSGVVNYGWFFVDWGSEGGVRVSPLENLTHACTSVHKGPPEAADCPSEEPPVHDRAPAYEHGDTNPAGLPRMPEPGFHECPRCGYEYASNGDCSGCVALFGANEDSEQSFDDFLASREKPAGPEIEVGDVVRVVLEARVRRVGDDHGNGHLLSLDETITHCHHLIHDKRCTVIRKKGEL